MLKLVLIFMPHSVDIKATKKLMDMLQLKQTVDELPKINEVKRYEHVLERDDDSVLRVALDFGACFVVFEVMCFGCFQPHKLLLHSFFIIAE